MKHIITYPGIFVSPVQVRVAKDLLEKSQPTDNDFLAGMTRFLEVEENDAQALVGRHPKYGWYHFPIIPQKIALQSNSWNQAEGVSTQQKWVRSAKDSLASALFAVDPNFNPNTDYIYVKVDF